MLATGRDFLHSTYGESAASRHISSLQIRDRHTGSLCSDRARLTKLIIHREIPMSAIPPFASILIYADERKLTEAASAD